MIKFQNSKSSLKKMEKIIEKGKRIIRGNEKLMKLIFYLSLYTIA